MNAALIEKIAREVLVMNWRDKLHTEDGKKFKPSELAEIAKEIAQKCSMFESPTTDKKTDSNDPLPGQLDFTGGVVGLPEPKWKGGLCPTCGGGKTRVAADGRLRVNCSTCAGSGDQEEWNKRRAARAVISSLA